MTLEQFSRLECMCAEIFGRKTEAIWDLSREDQNAIYAAIRGMPNPRLVEALKAVLMFHEAGPWDSAKILKWFNLTGSQECTTKSLCDFIRQQLAEPFGPHVPSVVRAVAS